MEELQDDLKIYSEEVRDVLSATPKAILKWGNTIVLFFIIMLGALSWFIKYPDIVSTQIVITTQTPPEKLIARTSGKIEALLVRDREVVVKNTPLAVIENTANYKDVFLLKSIVDTINLNQYPFPFEKLKALQLGEIESAFSLFHKEYITDELNAKLQPFKVEGNAQTLEAVQLKERLALLESQKSINQNELLLQKSDMERYEKLFSKGIVAAQEMERQRLIYMQAEKNYQNLLSSISQMKSSLNDLNSNSKTTRINETMETVTLEQNLVQSFFELRKSIKTWELNYLLRSSIEGKVTFLQIWTANQTVTEGDNVFAIIPVVGKDYIGKVKALAQNSGKIEAGQDVNIRLVNFPDRQYGMLRGKVSDISLTPDKEGNLLINVALPEGLLTSYNKKIAFQQEMSGSAEIITEDLRLIERLLYQFRDIFRR